MKRPRMFRPDLTIDGPHARRPQTLTRRAIDFAITVAVVWLLSFAAGALLRHVGVL